MKDNTKSALAANLKLFRKRTGLTQSAVASALGIERSRYAHYENNTTPSAENLRKLAAIFNITVDELLGERPSGNVFTEFETQSMVETFVLNELRNDEKSLVIKYRLLSPEAKESIMKSLEDKINKSEM